MVTKHMAKFDHLYVLLLERNDLSFGIPVDIRITVEELNEIPCCFKDLLIDL